MENFKVKVSGNDLPFIDSEESLNDRVASAEEARQKQPNQKTIDAMREAENMIQKTLNERQSSYGCFEDVAFLTQTMIDLLNTHTKFKDMPKPHKESLHMIFSKISRLTLGDHNHKDSWHDIQGYAKLVEDLIE